jgi:hypothetical protein
MAAHGRVVKTPLRLQDYATAQEVEAALKERKRKGVFYFVFLHSLKPNLDKSSTRPDGISCSENPSATHFKDWRAQISSPMGGWKRANLGAREVRIVGPS